MTFAGSTPDPVTSTTGIPPRLPGDAATSSGIGIATIISSKMARCCETSPPRSSGPSRERVEGLTLLAAQGLGPGSSSSVR